MCGIVGYVGTRKVADVLVKGLRRLEYRGYDSTGVAILNQGRLEIRKSEGKLENVERILSAEAKADSSKAKGSLQIGIGHTRWATHGKPTTQNAHPHRAEHIALVHNGIIENYQELKREILNQGYLPVSETDSELFGFLVLEQMKQGLSLELATRKSFLRLEGACSIVVISEKEPDLMIGVRRGSPLVAAVDPQGGSMIASDGQPLLEYTKDVYFLEHGDLVVAKKDSLQFFDLHSGQPVKRSSTHLDWSADQLELQGFNHFMQKEIFEQPSAILNTIDSLVERNEGKVFKLADHPGVKLLESAREITLIACGTSYHAALMGKYWLEKLAKIPTQVELASEFKYRDPVLRSGHLVVGLTQSGETLDTLAALQQVKRRGIPTLAVSNVRGSSVSREADAVFYTSAGPEIGVAATKTFTAQMLALMLFAGHLGWKRAVGKDPEDLQYIRNLFSWLLQLPGLLSNSLEMNSSRVKGARVAAKATSQSRGFFFIGRGYQFPIALEGALKLKEIAYVHAEGYAGGELKHGPIAMIDQQMTVIALCPQDQWFEKTLSNIEEVKARGAQVWGITHEPNEKLAGRCVGIIESGLRGVGTFGNSGSTDSMTASGAATATQKMPDELLPFLLIPSLQLLSYELALLKGTDVDKPRNLAKSVTVE